MTDDITRLVAVIHFGNDLYWERIFNIWFHQFRTYCPTVRFAVITTEESKSNLNVPGIVLRVPMRQYAGMIRGEPGSAVNKMDIKEALMLHAIRVYSADERQLLVVDSDAIFQDDPFKHIPVGAIKTFGMAMDPLVRYVSKGVIEKQAGVLYTFGDVGQKLYSGFVSCWQELYPSIPTKSVLLGQKAWSLAHHRFPGSFILDNKVNWSRMQPENGQAAIVHYHGTNGKEQLFARYDYKSGNRL